MSMLRTGLFLVLMGGTAFAQAGTVSVQHPWARATLPHQTLGVAYLTMTSTTGDTLTGVETPAAGMAMLHISTMKNGVSEMRDMEQVALPPGKHVVFAPKGMHIMLMDMKQPLKAGDTLHLTLDFQKAGQVQVDAPVLPASASAPP